MKNKLTIIIPVHILNESVYSCFEKSLTSVVNQKIDSKNVSVLFVTKPELVSDIEKYIATTFPKNKKLFTVLGNTIDEFTFQSQVNFAVKNIKSEYFSILEFDDEISNTYFKTFDEYVNLDDVYKNIDILMPILTEIDVNGNVFKLTNNIAWSKQLIGSNGRMGYLNVDMLKEYTDFKLCGAFIKTEMFNNVGGLKQNIKLSFVLEFLLRALNSGAVVYNLPKILYLHLDGRKDSLFEDYKMNMSMDERKFWFESAYKEYFFQNDRVIQYVPTI